MTTAVPIALPDGQAPSRAESLAQLHAAEPGSRAAIYELLVFPHAAQAAMQAASEAPHTRLLIVPVGTQPYSPLLAVLHCRPGSVALLVTEGQAEGADGRQGTPGSRPTAARVQATLAQIPDLAGVPVEAFSIGTGTAGDAVVRAVGAALLWAGDPPPVDVTIDISGGLKATTASLGGVAAVLGCRVSYIEGRPAGNGFFIDERRHALADVGGLVASDQRAAAGRLLRAGAFAAAAAELRAVQQSLLPDPVATLLLDVAEALSGPGDVMAALDAVGADLAANPGRSVAAFAEALGSGANPPERVNALLDALFQAGAWR